MKHVFINYFNLFLAMALLSTCSNDNLPKYIDLKELRVLALQAGSSGGIAEFSPGDTVTITPYISDYLGGSRALTYEAFACFDPGIQVGVDPVCAGVPGAVSLGSGSVAAPSTGRTGSTSSFSVSIPSLIFANRSARDQYNGVSYLVTYRLSAAGGESVQAFKRIVVSLPSKATKNRNPQLSDLLANGSSLATFPTGQTRLSASYPSSSIENYDTKKADLSLAAATEELLTTWFISDGELEYFRTVNATTTLYKSPGSAPIGRQPLIVGVTRDDRGGVTVIVREF